MIKDLDVKSQKIYGSSEPIDGNFSLAFEFEPEDANTLSLRGRFYMVFSIESSTGVDLQLASKLFVDAVKEHYYGDLDGTPLQSLETSLNAGREKLFEIVSGASAIPIKFDVVCCIVWGSVLYVAQFGKTSAIIIRGGQYTDISHKTSGDIMTSSGILENEDVVILASKAFEDEFLNASLIQNLSSLETLFASSLNKALLASVVISFKKNMFPTKKSFSALVSKFKKKELDKPLNSNLGIPKEPNFSNDNQSINVSQDLSPKISSLTEGPVSPATVETPSNFNFQNIREKENTPEPKKGRKRKKLLLLSAISVFSLFLVSFLIFQASVFIPKMFQKPTEILATKVETNKDKFNSLLASNAVKEDYTRLLNDINKETEKELFSEIEKYISDNFEKTNILSENVIYDFAINDKNISLNSFEIVKNTILVLDSANKNAYLLDISDLKNIVVKNLALNGDYQVSLLQNSLIYFFSTNKMLSGSTFENLKETTLDLKVTNISQAVFYGTNFYILSPSSILKIDNTNLVTSWASNLENATSFSIDSNIFVNNNGKIEKFFKGQKTDFALSTSVKLDNTSLVYTDTENTNLYVFTKGILYLIDKKTGEIVKEQDTGLQEIKSIKVIANTLYAINKTSILKLEIK